MVKGASYDAPQYVAFSTLLLCHPSSVHIFFLASYSQTPSVSVPPLMSETKFITYTEPQQNYNLVHYKFYVFEVDEKTKDFELSGTCIKCYLNSIS
jgi:hypothetical protein